MKTLADERVQAFLADRFVLLIHNQLPELYCNSSIDPGTDRYPGDQVDTCPEAAGGGNLRVILCRPTGEVVFELLGFWKPTRFLEEMRCGMEILRASSNQAEAERLHHAARARHRASSIRSDRLLVRSHEESLAMLLKPLREILDQIEDEIYTKGAIG